MSQSETSAIPPLEPDCRFCYPPEPWRIIQSTQHFNIQMGLGPLAEGYALILSRFHYSCCAEISEISVDEFRWLIQAVRQAQTNLYGKSLLFEHGRSGACLPPGHGEDLCYHAHLHLLPVTVNLADSIMNDFPSASFEDWASVRQRYALAGRPYVLAQKENGLIYAETPDKIRPRYLRSIIAKALGEPELEDWVAFPRYHIVRYGRDAMATELSRIMEKSKIGRVTKAAEGWTF